MEMAVKSNKEVVVSWNGAQGNAALGVDFSVG